MRGFLAAAVARALLDDFGGLVPGSARRAAIWASRLMSEHKAAPPRRRGRGADGRRPRVRRHPARCGIGPGREPRRRASAPRPRHVLHFGVGRRARVPAVFVRVIVGSVASAKAGGGRGAALMLTSRERGTIRPLLATLATRGLTWSRASMAGLWPIGSSCDASTIPPAAFTAGFLTLEAAPATPDSFSAGLSTMTATLLGMASGAIWPAVQANPARSMFAVQHNPWTTCARSGETAR